MVKVWSDELKKMVDVGKPESGNAVKVSVDSGLAEILENFAIEDGFDFTGITYITEKDKDGKTKKDNTGKPVFVKDKEGKIKTEKVERSQAKVNSAISQYVDVAIKSLIKSRTKNE